MKQASIPEEWQIKIDFEASDYSRTVKILHPTVYKDGDSYCCLLGPDPLTGIFGCGDKPIDAIKDWEKSVEIRLGKTDEKDEVVQYVIDSLNTSKKDVW